ncbi:MAG: diguanylate cyclase [Halieaceae bacterium]|jgi:diguanylate cyclase|nr:diguanylate cyclase [Halieaceae bacterium]
MKREQALEQLSLRVSHLAFGIDPEIDELLAEIRKAVRDNASGNRLADLSSTLARTLLSTSGIDLDNQRVDAAGYDLSGLRRLIKSMPVESDEQERMNGLVRKAAAGQNAASRQKALVELLGAAAAALHVAAGNERSQGRVLGWLGKKPSGEDQRYVSLFSALLQRLVDHIDVFNGSAVRSSEIREALEHILHPSQAEALLIEVTEEIERIDARIRAERSQTSDFLGDLRERLDGFEGVIDLLADGSDRSLERSERLQSEVESDARSIDQATAKAVAAGLHDMLSSGLARITRRLADHVVAEREQHEQSTARVEELKERLATLEDEADILRAELRNKNDLVLKDALTGAYNRAGYEERAKELYARWQRSGASLALVFVDCDKFKQINDTFGHTAGDLVLVKLAEILMARSRASDIVCRFGGDEFVVLLPDTRVAGAEVFARSCCQEIADAGFNDNGRPLQVSISCGVSELREGDEFEDAVARADAAMYAAKGMSGIRVAVQA